MSRTCVGQTLVRVALAARRRTELERVAARIAAAGGSTVSVRTDVADDAQLHGLVDRVERQLGPIDILVNAAGVPYRQPLHELDIDHWDVALDVNLRGPTVLVRPGPAQHASTSPRDDRQHLQRSGVFVHPGIGEYAVSKDAPAGADRTAAGGEPGARDQGMGGVPRNGRHADVRGHPADAVRERFLTVEEVTDVVEGLVLQRGDVKLGPQILIRTMQNPWVA